MKTKNPELDSFLQACLEEEKKNFHEGVRSFSQHAEALSHKFHDAMHEYRQSYERGFQAFEEYLKPDTDEKRAEFTQNPELFLEAVENGAAIWALLGFSFEALVQFYEFLSRLFDAKEYQKVKDGFIFLTTVSSETALFWTGLGIVLTRLHQYEQADEAFVQAIELDPKSADAYLGAIHLYVKQKQYQEAITLADQGIAYAQAHRANELEDLLVEAKKELTAKEKGHVHD